MAEVRFVPFTRWAVRSSDGRVWIAPAGETKRSVRATFAGPGDEVIRVAVSLPARHSGRVRSRR